MVQDAHGGDDRIEPPLGALVGDDLPGAVPPVRRLNLAVEPDPGLDPIVRRHLAHVGLDLRARRVLVAPLRIGSEGEAVEVRGHVAGNAGIGVVPPGPAWLPGLFEDHHVAHAALAQPDGRSDTAGTGADHRESQSLSGPGHRGPPAERIVSYRRAPRERPPRLARNTAFKGSGCRPCSEFFRVGP